MPDILEEFEEWYIREFFDGDKECAAAWMITDPVSGGYLMDRPAQYLKAWQASRAALKVELPKPEYFGDHWSGDWAYNVEDTKDALREAGIEVVK